MKITAKQIHEMSQDLQVRMKVFINRKDFEIKTIFDFEYSYGDTEFGEEELEKIESEWTNYTTLTKMESHEAFQIMEDFVEEIDNTRFQEDLIKILNRKSPFANFKAEIESSAFRQKWFDFRDKKHEDYVRKELKLEGFEIE